MTETEKQELTCLILQEISKGRTVKETIIRLGKYGYKDATIRRYYKAFNIREKNNG